MPLVFSASRLERVDGLARAQQVDARLPSLFLHQAELQHGSHVERSHEALEGHLHFFGGVAAEFDARIQFFGRSCGRRRPAPFVRPRLERAAWTPSGRRGRSAGGAHSLPALCSDASRRRSRFGSRNLFFADFPAQFAVGREQSPVGYGKTVLLLLRHNSFLRFTWLLLTSTCSMNGRLATRRLAAAGIDHLARRCRFAADITQRHATIAARQGAGKPRW